MSAADNYEAANLAEQAKERERARQKARSTITTSAAVAIGLAACVVAVLACITTMNIMDALNAVKNGRCT
jgi:hypothetical protein